MALSKTLAYLGVIATVFGATYMHDRSHRYDVVAAGDIGGGSAAQAGGDSSAVLVDHVTGRVWFIAERDLTAFPVTRLACKDIGQEDEDSGCKYKGKPVTPGGAGNEIPPE